MSTPSLYTFFGQAGGNSLFQYPAGSDDDGVAINVRFESGPWAPDGPGGEAIFAALYLTIESDIAAELLVTPIIDGVAQDGTSGAPDARVTVTLAAGALQVRVYECPLTYPLLDPGDATVQLARFYLRGRQCAIRVESVGGIEEGTLIFETPELEVEVLRETTATVSP